MMDFMGIREGLLERIRSRLFHRATAIREHDAIIEEPRSRLDEEEISQGKEYIQLRDQLLIIRLVKEHMREYVLPGLKLDSSWTSGYSLQNEVFVSYMQELIYRCNMEVFYQDKDGRKKLVYLVSLIKFGVDRWRVFQLKGGDALID